MTCPGSDPCVAGIGIEAIWLQDCPLHTWGCVASKRKQKYTEECFSSLRLNCCGIS